MQNNSGKKILFTVWYADGFHGAVMHIAEIAEYLITKGWDVYCVCSSMSDDIKKYYNKKGIKVSLMGSCNYAIEYDVIWNIHFPVLPYLLKNGIKYKKIIFNSLSSFLEVESPPVFHEEYPLLLAVSEEAKDRMVNYYKVDSDKVRVLNNVVPLNYFAQQKGCNKAVKKVIIVSNHVPQELSDSVALFREKGIDCDIIGKEHNILPICPELLLQYDVVITIGKTVQYSLALGIPCYNYDYLGGSGYITESNIKTEEYYNFSGRSCKTQKSGSEIVSEIIEGYDNAIQSAEKLREYAKEKYSVSAQIDPITDYIESLPDTQIDLGKYPIIIDQYYFMVDIINRFYARRRRAKRKKNKSVLKKLFSVTYEYHNNSRYRVIRILGIKLKIKQALKKF